MTEAVDPRDRASIVSDLASSDEDVRRLAVERVAELPIEDGLSLLAAQLGDPSWRVRKAVVDRIVTASDPDAAAAALVAALADAENPGRRNSAVEALMAGGRKMVPGLLDATRSPDEDVRKFAIDALAGIGDPAAASCLLEAMGDPDPNVRGAAAEALGSVPCELAASRLLVAAVDTSEELVVRYSALRAVAALEPPVHSGEIAAVLDDPTLRSAGFALLGRCVGDAGAIRTLLKGLSAHGRGEREAAVGGLLRVLSRSDDGDAEDLIRRIREALPAGSPLIEDATERLIDADAATRLRLLQFLGLLDDEAVVLPILGCAREEVFGDAAVDTLALLGDTAEAAIASGWDALDTTSRRHACSVLGMTSGERGRDRLLAALRDPDVDVRLAGAEAVGRRRIGAALPVMLARLEELGRSADPDVDDERLALVSSIAAVAEPRPGAEREYARVLARLQEWLDEPHEALRLAVAMVISGVGRAEEAHVVTRLLKDPSPAVRRTSVRALERLDRDDAAEPLRVALADEAPRVRLAAVVALGASDAEGVLEDLLPLTQDSDVWVRAAAVRAVGVRSTASDALDERVREVIDRALGDEVLVALGAVEALSEVGGADATRVLSLFERDEPELLKEAIGCLERHATAAQLEAVVPLVDHAEWSVRAEAIRALSARGVARAAPAILRRLDVEEDAFVREVMLRGLERMGA